MKSPTLFLLIMILLFSYCCTETPTNEEKNIGNGRIDLNGKIENIEIGMDSVSVVNILGEPDYYGYADVHFRNRTLGYFIDTEGELEITLIEDFVVDSSFAVMGVKVRRNYLGTTKNGLGIGSTRQEVMNILNDANSFTVPEGLSKLNTRFLFSYNDEDKVDQISMDFYKY